MTAISLDEIRNRPEDNFRIVVKFLDRHEITTRQSASELWAKYYALAAKTAPMSAYEVADLTADTLWYMLNPRYGAFLPAELQSITVPTKEELLSGARRIPRKISRKAFRAGR